MTRSRWILVSSLALSALTACGSDTGETAGPPLAEAGSTGESGAGGEWGIGGESGSAGDSGSAGESSSAGQAGSVGEAGAAGADADAGAEIDAGDAGAGGSAGAGGTGGSGGTGGTGGSSGSFSATGGTSGSGGSGGSSGSFSAAGGTSGSGGSGGGSATLTTFITNLTQNELSVYCPGGIGQLVGSYTANYKNVLYTKATAAAVTKSHVMLSKSGQPTMSYAFTVTPAASSSLAQGSSSTVEHSHIMNSGAGTNNPCLYCGGTMTLDVEWLLSNGETRKDSFGPVAVKCFSP